MWLLYCCLFWYTFFFFFLFVSGAHRHILTVNFFITSYHAPLCHHSPPLLLSSSSSSHPPPFDSQPSKSSIWKKYSKKCRITLWIAMRRPDSKVRAKWAKCDQFILAYVFFFSLKPREHIRKREREREEKKKRYMTNLCCGISANPCSVKCSHSGKHSCYHHPSTPITACYFT